MLVNLTKAQLEKIIQQLEKNPEEVNDKFSTLNYLKIVKQNDFDSQPVAELDDIPF